MNEPAPTYTDVDDTIVAVCTARGVGLRGIVRLSGPNAFEITRTIFDPTDGNVLTEPRGFRCVDGFLTFDAHHRTPAQAYVFTNPHSYTRQDSVELHAIGSAPVLDMVVERCVRAGARPARPGEFTMRAYISGALTLSAAEAVASTINARTDEQLRAARRLMRGDLRDTVLSWQESLTDLLALVVADIDFAEEPIDFISTRELHSRIDDLHKRLRKLIASVETRARVDVVPHVLLLGLPNAGKSTLLNALSGTDRAIASAVSGTTRDILAAPAKLGDVEAILLDSAGVDESPDEVLMHARQRATEMAGTVDLVCIVVDASVPFDGDAITRLRKLADGPTMVIATKMDAAVCTRAETKNQIGQACDHPVCEVSSATGDGITDLRDQMGKELVRQSTDSEHSTITLTANQRQALADAEDAIQRCLELTTTSDNLLDIAELVALELREALDSLAMTTGSVTTEDLLGRIFSSFCIGK